MTVNYNIFGQQLRECSDSFIVSGSRNYLELHFNFSGDWDIDGLTRFVQFHKGNTVIEKIIEDDGNVLVPSAVLEDSEDFYVTVFGMTSTDFSDILITTNKIAVNLHEMGMSGANTTDEQVVPLWERVFGKLTELIESLHKICYSGHYDDLEGAPELSPVATSGDYNDLENKPELYTPGDTLDIGSLNIDGSGYNSVLLSSDNKNIDVLVSTTVIEVGINVPNATVMMVENAERFGLAQLHQLRGRVGRGEYQSYCIFINTNESKESSARLDILNRSNDGFYIASEDLKLRGPGDLFGIRQSGDFAFRVGDVFTDADILQLASEAVERVCNGYLTEEEYQQLVERLKINEVGMVDFRSI